MRIEILTRPAPVEVVSPIKRKMLGSCAICEEPCRRPDALCQECYDRTRKARAEAGVPDRFWSKVDRSGLFDCWLWTGPLNWAGYGIFREGGKDSRHTGAHRMAYRLVVGPIPDGLTIDHLCGNRACQNPVHMEPVTIGENVRRGVPNRRPRPHLRKAVGL